MCCWSLQAAREDLTALREAVSARATQCQALLDAAGTVLAEIPGIARVPGAVTPEAATLLTKVHAEATR